MQRILRLVSFIFIISIIYCKKYDPDWDSLDQRPLPEWYDDAKIGIFIHWGVFSVPSFRSEWFWWHWNQNTTEVVDFMRKNYPPNWTYADFANQFNTEFYDPFEWAEIFEASGAKYVVLTSKHHDGYCNWPSANSFNWNSMDVGPKRDLTGELANAIRKNTTLRFGLYHSLYEWFNPLYIQDQKSKYKTQDFVKFKTMPELYDIVMNYEPEVIWSDGDWEVSYDYWNSTSFLAWLYNDSPVKDTVVVNDRWGAGAMCKHGDFYTCTDNYNPKKLLAHKWENCMPLDKNSWGFRRTMRLEDILTMEEVIASVVESVSCGGNILINVGPTKEGRIVPIFEERLRQLGSWLRVNGEAIYGSKPWKYQNDTTNPNVWYTAKDENVYAILLSYPSGEDQGKVKLTSPQATEDTKVTMLGYDGELSWTILDKGGLVIDVSTIMPTKLPCKWAWTFKLTDI